MTIITIPVPRKPILDLMERLAPSANVTQASDALYGPPLGDMKAAIAESWDRITALIEKTVSDGWASVREEVRQVSARIKQIASDLGQKANEFLDRIVAKIQEAITNAIDIMLGSVRTEIVVGGAPYSLESVDIENKFGMSTEIGATLESLCKLVGEGELTVKGSYRAKGQASNA